jgi:hypothetical protein
MAVKTTLAQIEETQAAITAVMGGQAYTMDGVSFTRANLDALTKRETMLLQRYAREQGTTPRVSKAQFVGGFE